MVSINIFRSLRLVLLTTFAFGSILSAIACVRIAGGETKASGFLKGIVRIGPLCPVEPCNISPKELAATYAARKVIVYNSDKTTVVKELNLEQNGRYGVELAAGQYIVDINHVGIDRSQDVPRRVTIAPGRIVTVDIDIDTGMR